MTVSVSQHDLSDNQSTYRNKAREILGDTPLAFAVPLNSKDFRDHLALAHQHGATHISIGKLPSRYDAFLPDNTDPYPNWSQGALSLFRVVPPEGIKPFMPADVVKYNLNWLDERVAAVREFSLRIVINGIEPMWLPEAVYAAHPRWRGVQCELGRIAGKPYWCPSIDEPEVISLYREATQMLCERYPEIDRLSFWTNDCGAGLPWSIYSYPGLNGPNKHRMRDPGLRIAGWLNGIRQGAIDAGGDVTINLNTFSFPPAESAAIRAKLGSNLFLNSINGDDERISGGNASSGGGVVGTPTNPVQGHFNQDQFAQQLSTVFNSPDGRMRSITLGNSVMNESTLILQAYLDHPGSGVVDTQKALVTAAQKLVGNAGADQLVRTWSTVQQAVHCLNQLRQRGVSMSIAFGTTASRWLVRPLVPEPIKLTEQEKSHYLPMLFSVDGEEINANLCEVLGKPVFIGDSVVWMTRWCIDEAQKHLAAAQRNIVALLKTELTDEQRQSLRLYEARIAALHCVAECGRLTIMYQHALDTTHIPRFAANPLDFDDNMQFDQRALELRKIARMDLDNTFELMEILEAFEPNEVLAQAASEQQETVFLYGPNLIEKLGRKREIMLTHWHDYERLFPTSKRYEFEPLPREQPLGQSPEWEQRRTYQLGNEDGA